MNLWLRVLVGAVELLCLSIPEYICQENNTNTPHIQGPAKVVR